MNLFSKLTIRRLSQLRILAVLDYLPNIIGGAEVSAFLVAKGLVDEGNHVYILTEKILSLKITENPLLLTMVFHKFFRGMLFALEQGLYG